MDDDSGSTPGEALGRPQRRLLRRIFNGRTTPLVVEGLAFLTYGEASRFLRSLPPDARDIAYATMKQLARDQTR